MMRTSKLGAPSWSIPLATPVAVIPEHRKPTAPASAALLAAVIETAATDATYDGEVGNDAREWFCSESYAPYSFLWSCDVLHIDADALRARVLSQRRIPQPPNRSTGNSHHATAGGCRALGCGWVGVDICTDPVRHNPACVARGDSRVVVPVIERIVPKCQRCGVQTYQRHGIKSHDRSMRVCAPCHDALSEDARRRRAAQVNPSLLRARHRRALIIAEAERNAGLITPNRAALAGGIKPKQARAVLARLATTGVLRRVGLGVYEVIR